MGSSVEMSIPVPAASIMQDSESRVHDIEEQYQEKQRTKWGGT